ncbi:MAG: hypothetical protein HDR25_06765 [Lachnospiraceae bacterium]|nr:hypothetical protein [Lachnospiraceae bacterium]
MNSLKYYEKTNFINEYIEYLNKPNRECPYEDIDTVRYKDVVFYNDLAKFLEKMLGLGFKGPDKSDYPFAIKFQDNQDVMYLTSDQFGFSVPYSDISKKHKKSKAWNGEKSYPYARYLSVRCDDDKGADDSEQRRFVASCIYGTRTIGGSFIWPKVKIGRDYKSIYNMHRGVGGYIEDRVDITLHEINCFYDVYSEKKINYKSFEEEYKEKYPNNILFIRQCEDEKKAIYRWLSIFETFEGYVEKLKFADFVIKKEDKYLIRDMANEDTSTALDITKIKKIRDMDHDKELYILLKNVKESTELRSKAIEEVLNN